ncbi:uncharacterized protein LOC127732248 [Mytilus californianus]|uniref:uncharacterized protein LOC127732248 n=1 Tax=Mytilus californianus TaxID=6549 RepID=UPI0022476260|nr:uncharacterized protein LOC127732248 [Mytilus californianus]
MSSGSCLGYRPMTKRLLSHLLSRDTVAHLQKIITPEGVNDRKHQRFTRRSYINKGPDYLLHIDGYDKIKPYGFAIHGAICGYSRRILLLQVGRTNNNPKVVSEFRIERCWLSNRQGGGQFWIAFMKDLQETGIFSSANHAQVECLHFCFTGLIQKDLNHCRQDWNQHKIRQTRQAESPGGKPDLLYYIPELSGTCVNGNPHRDAKKWKEDMQAILRNMAVHKDTVKMKKQLKSDIKWIPEANG